MAGSFASASSRYLSYAGALPTTYPFTLACWFNSTTMGTNKALFSINTAGSANNIHMLRTNTSDQLEAFSRTTTTDVGSTVATYSSGVDSHACGVWSSATSRTPYLNGTAGTAGTVSKSPSGMDTTYIGRYSSTTQYMNGNISEVAAWNVALGAAEISALADGVCPLLIRPTALVFYNPMVRTLTNDVRGGLVMTNNGSVGVAAHPRVILPTSQQVQRFGSGGTTVGRLVNRGLLTGGLVGGRLAA